MSRSKFSFIQHYANPIAGSLFALAAVLIVLSALLVLRFGSSAYFVATGRPFSWGTVSRHDSQTDILPTFTTTQVIASTTLSAGQTQIINISASSSRATSAVIKAWITSPKRKQIWRSPEDKVTSFPAGKAVASAYSYVIPAGLPPGTYQVSFILNTPDEHTDYVVKEDFAEFSVQ